MIYNKNDINKNDFKSNIKLLIDVNNKKHINSLKLEKATNEDENSLDKFNNSINKTDISNKLEDHKILNAIIDNINKDKTRSKIPKNKSQKKKKK